jgi:hypothetical protein
MKTQHERAKAYPKDKVTLKISLLDFMGCSKTLLITSLGRLNFRQMDLKKSDETLSFLASKLFHTKSHLQLISSEMLRLEVDT